MIQTTTEAQNFIRHQVGEIFSGHHTKTRLALTPLDEPRFCTWPASSMGTKDRKTWRGHHCFYGGLLIHTAQVLDFSLAAARPLAPPRDILFEHICFGVLFHDFAKIEDYEPIFNGEIIQEVRKTWEYEHIHHMFTSTSWFEQRALQCNLPKDQIQQVKHIILSHHGRPEWGSAVTPRTPAARIVHAADDLSAKHYGIYEDFVQPPRASNA
jgi:23S rRNA maturation-related 3'-5' exoribonuclease YhaM